jgi:D-alanyl-D-alanine carboxypeptidase
LGFPCSAPLSWRPGQAFSAGQALAVTQAAIVVDAKTGKVLYASNADTKAYPASLTKR